MAYSPIAFVAPNYRDYKNNWIKAYEPSTTTPKSMSLDSDGTTLVAKLELNTDGFIVSAGQALVMPYIEGSYDLWLFPTEAQADSNDTSNTLRVADNIIATSGGGGGGGGEVGTTLDTVADIATYDAVEGEVITTSGYHTVNDGGGASYLITGSGLNDGYLNHLTNNNFTSELLPVGANYLIEQAGIIADGVHNNYEAFTAILNSEKRFTTNLVDSDIGIDGIALIDNKTVDLDLNNNTLLSIGNVSERLIFLRNLLDLPVHVSDLTFSTGRTRITLTLGHGIIAGDIVKLYSNQNINPYSSFTQQRCAEYFEVESVTSTTLVCIGKHIFDHSVNGDTSSRRVARMAKEKTCNLRNIKIRRDLPHKSNHYAEGITAVGYVAPKLTNIHATYYHVALLVVASCFRAIMTNITSSWQADVTGDNALGYVGVDRGSQESKWFNLSSGACRHTYTTGANSINETDYLETRPDQYGGAVRCHVMSGVAVGTTNFAYDTHQDAWECEFHDITVYDDHSNTYASSGAFQDRSQNTIVHKLTHISDGKETSGGETTVLYNTGARNTYIKEIFMHNGGGIRSFGLADSLTALRQSFKIDKITVYQEKYLPRVVQMSEPFNLTIGQIDIVPSDASIGYYSSGGASVFKMTDIGAHLKVHELNLRWDSANLPAISTSGDYLLILEGDVGSFECNINTYTNANTYPKIEKSMSGVRAPDVVSTLKRSVINWTAYVSDWDDTFTKDGTIYYTPEVTGATDPSNLVYSYKVVGNGIPRGDCSNNILQGAFDPSFTLATYDKKHYGLQVTGGITSEWQKRVTMSGQSSNASIGEITAPDFAGQALVLTNLNWNATGIITDIEIDAGAINTDNAVTRIIGIGETLTLVSYDKNGALIWNVPPVQP